jgi:hypothetical protein
MSFSAEINPTFGPVRRGIIRVLLALFVIGLVGMLLLGAIVVFLQLGGLILGNAQFIVDAEKAVGPACYAVSAAFGVITLLVALAFGWKSND